MNGMAGLRSPEQVLCDELNAAAVAEFNRQMALRREGTSRPIVTPLVTPAAPIAITGDDPWKQPPGPVEAKATLEAMYAALEGARHRVHPSAPDEAECRERLRGASAEAVLAQQALVESRAVIENSLQLMESLQLQLVPFRDLEEQCAQHLAGQLQRGEMPQLSQQLIAGEMQRDRLHRTLSHHQSAHQRILSDFKAIEQRAHNTETYRQVCAGQVAVLRVYRIAERLELLEQQALAYRQELLGWASVQQPNGTGPMLLPSRAYGLVHSAPVNAAADVDKPDHMARMKWESLLSVLADDADANVLELGEEWVEPHTQSPEAPA